MRGLTVSGSPARIHALVLWVLLFQLVFGFYQQGINDSSPRPAAQIDTASTEKLNSLNLTITAWVGKDTPIPANFLITFNSTIN